MPGFHFKQANLRGCIHECAKHSWCNAVLCRNQQPGTNYVPYSGPQCDECDFDRVATTGGGGDYGAWTCNRVIINPPCKGLPCESDQELCAQKVLSDNQYPSGYPYGYKYFRQPTQNYHYGCRTCNVHTHKGCSGATPACEPTNTYYIDDGNGNLVVSAGGGGYGKCVQCTTNSHCTSQNTSNGSYYQGRWIPKNNICNPIHDQPTLENLTFDRNQNSHTCIDCLKMKTAHSLVVTTKELVGQRTLLPDLHPR